MQRVTVALPASLLEDVDREAVRLGIPRSRLIRQALKDRFSDRNEAEIEALMAEGYREKAAEHAEWVRGIAALQEEVAEGFWT